MPAASGYRLALPLLAALLCGLLATFSVPARPAQAAPTIVQTIGTATGGGGQNSLTINVATAVAAGSSIIVAVEVDSAELAGSNAPTCSDGPNGAYSVEATQQAAEGRLSVCTRHNAAALAPGDPITISWTNVPPANTSRSAAVAIEVAGVAANPLDRTASAVGTSTTPDSGLTAITSQASELLVGAIAARGGTVSFTPGTNGTADKTCATSGTTSYTSAGVAGSPSPLVLLEYCIVPAADAYRATATISNSLWLATILTYRADVALPSVTTSGGSLSYTENDPPTVIDSGLTVNDSDSPVVTGATVSITGNFQSGEDSLGFTNQSGITGSFVGNTLTLTGNATVANYQTALRSITYTNSSENPNTATRTVSFQVTDGGSNGSNTATRQIAVTAVDDPSALTTTASALSYSENAGAVAIDPGLTVADPDTVAGATVSISASFMMAEDILSFTNQLGITGSYNAGTGVLTLTGTASPADYQTALRSVTYTNSSEAPDPAARTITFAIAPAASATRQINLTTVNDPPVNTVPGSQTTPANTPLVFSTGNSNTISIADPDAGSGSLQVTLGVTAGTGTLSLGSTSGLTVNGNGTATVNATGTLTNLNAGLQGLTFTPVSGFTGSATLTVTTNDQGNTGTGGAQQDQDSVTINVGALPAVSVNDPPAAAEGDSGTPNSIVFTVTLSAQSNLQVTVPYTTANQTATGGPACTAGVDYLTTAGTLTFQPLDTSETIAMTLCPDVVVEGNETLLVTLGAPTNATVADGQGIGTITDDDLAGGVAFSAATVQVPELAGSVTITVQRGGVGAAGVSPSGANPPSVTAPTGNVPSGSIVPSASVRPNPAPGPRPTGPGTVGASALGAITVSYATANGTALAGQDYVATSGTLTFGVGETTKTITIPILVDNEVEGNESFTVTLNNPTGGAGLGQQATIAVTIVDTTHASQPPSPGDDDTDKPRKETEEQRQQRERTNQGNKDDVYTEGDVSEVHLDAQPPYVVLANRDGPVVVRLLCGDQCPTIRVGDYIEVDGEKIHEQLFEATDVTLR